MTLTIVQFDPGERLPTGRTRVYRRSRWEDDWTLDESLVPVEVVWACLPTMPTATLVLHYGRVKWFQDDDWTLALKRRNIARTYIKIEVDHDWDTDTAAYNSRAWHGVIEVSADQQLGTEFTEIEEDVWSALATGTQQLHAYGMEQLLARHLIRFSSFERSAASTNTELLIPFNRDGRGNRNATRFNGSYVFEENLDSASSWSSLNIAEYLLKRQSPRDSLSGVVVTFGLHSAAWLPSWDAPVIEYEEQTTLAVLQRIATRQRLISAWFEVDENTDIVELHTNTITTQPVLIALPGAGADPVPACSVQLHLIADEDQFTELIVKDTDLPVYDVVVATGAPEYCVGTFGFGDGSLEAGWSVGDEINYEAGASTSSGYGALSLSDKQKANAAARSDPRLDKVFSLFQVPRGWDQKVGDGLAGVDENPLFFDRADGAANPVYYPTMFVQSFLPLKAGVDYSGARLGNGTHGETKAAKEWLPPLVFFQRPDNSRWVRAEDIGNAADCEIETAGAFAQFSVHVSVPAESHGFTLRVAGAPQHAIAASRFTRLTVDRDHGELDYHGKMVATLCLPSGRKTQAQFPLVPPEGKDAIKVLEIDAGDGYASIYVAPHTAVGIATDGTLSRCFGGWLWRPANTQEQLAALAKLAAAWYAIPHQAVVISTRRLTTAIDLGDMIVKVGDERGNNQHQVITNAPVSELRVSWELQSGSEPSAPTFDITTFAAELDPIQVGPGRFHDPTKSLNPWAKA